MKQPTQNLEMIRNLCNSYSNIQTDRNVGSGLNIIQVRRHTINFSNRLLANVEKVLLT